MTKSSKPIFTITNRITAGLTRIERAQGFLEAATLSEVVQSCIAFRGREALIFATCSRQALRGRSYQQQAGCQIWP